jgi:hypothetical protein
MDNSQRITIASRKLKKVCSGLIVLLPLVCILFWTFFNQINSGGFPMSLPVLVNHDLPALTRFLSFLSELIPLSAVIYGLLKLRALFMLYQNGKIFTEENVTCFRSLGRSLIAWMICDVIRNSLLSMILTMDNPAGQKILLVGLNPADFTGIFVGIVILIITWVMDEARKIQEEQASFI